MAEVNFRLRQEIFRLREQINRELFRRRGELPGCRGCPLRLSCFRKSQQQHVKYCQRCRGWAVPEIRLIVMCAAFKLIESIPGARIYDACPNCNRLEGTYQTYETWFRDPTSVYQSPKLMFAAFKGGKLDSSDR